LDRSPLSSTDAIAAMRRVDQASKSKLVHFIQITHRDEVEAPITDWLQEAYELSDARAPKPGTARVASTRKPDPKKKKKKTEVARKTVAARKAKRS
jgi:hypothetical protein